MPIDIETVQDRFPEVKTSTSAGHLEYIVNCPKYHKKGGIYKLSINADTGAFMCHDCGYTGSAYREFFDEGAQFFPGLKINRSNQAAAMHHRVTVQRYRKEWRDGVPSPGKMVKVSSLDEAHPAIEYLQNRGISKEQCDEFGLGYCTEGYFDFSARMGTNTGRIIFPILMDGTLIGWQARQIEKKIENRKSIWKGETNGWWQPRLIDDGTGTTKYEDQQVPKYYSCPGMHRSKCLLNYDVASQHTDFVVVVEGPIDAVKVGKHAVATFGKRLTKDQVRILCARWSRVIMLLDGEVDTEENWFKNLESSFRGVHFAWMKLEGFEDPGAASHEEIWKQLSEKFRDLNACN